MSSDDDFDAVAYKAFEDQLYEEQSSSGSDDDLDSEVEEVLYSQVHYASSLVLSGNYTPGKKTPETRKTVDSALDAQGQKGHLNSSVIEISSDDDSDDNDSGNDYADDHEDVNPASSFSYPEVVNIFCDGNFSAAVEGTSRESSDVQNKVKPGEIAENWDLDERDLQDSKATKQRPRYYTPGKGLPHVKCYNCNEKGHLSQNCPLPKKISVCFLCGGVGHVKRHCPNELCFNCYEPGHISKQCRKPRRRPYDRCNRCHVLGHIAVDCPDRWRQYHLTTEVGPVIRPDRPVSSPSPVYCYNCGDQGHYGYECQEENATMRSELPLPFVVCYDGCGQVSSSREKNNHEKQNPKRRSKDKKQHRAMSQGFYDQPRQQDCDMDWRLFQPPPEKIRKTDDSDVRRVSFHDDSYDTSEFNSPYADRTPNRNNNRNKRKKKPERCERIVEILDPSPSHDGLIEEPYVFKKKKAKKRGKQRWQGGDRSDNNFHNVNLNARNSSKQHRERRFSNPQRKEDYRSFEDKQFDSERTSRYPRKENNKFTSDRGFQFNNESRRKKGKPRYLKRYTF
ncbi:zinc finger CCHC domain-containing protein 7-like isoform X2 [Orbicella faveolata]|uniref:zinc finger CCHC domain-containing protein 7-like isoform X2 n=1 Tax=Orbicella faveolata TaxID=48498 RepID=UPI0009E3F136|nr:zinc finger CCHC domain-containing protein 7-like isoform X2 [Orbicella faveolata]